MQAIRLSTADWAVLIAYLAGISLVGLLAGRKVRNTDQYFLGERRFNRWLMIAQSFATGTRAEMVVAQAGAVYSLGFSAIWFQWKNLFATPFYWMMAPVFRRVKRTTMAEMLEDRYGPWMGAVYTVFALIFFTVNMAGMLKGAGKVISQATGGNVPVNEIVIAMTVVFAVYSFVGGLSSAAWADMLQGFLILVLSYLVIPLGWSVVGGMSGMRAALDPHMFSLATPKGIGPWFIFMLTLNGLIGIMAMPHLIAVAGTGRDEKACRTGMMYGNFVKRFCTIGWALVGLIVAAMFALGEGGGAGLGEPEEAFGYACRRLLFSGGVGLLIACVLAANMAGCATYTINSSALFTRNFYGRYFMRNQSDAHYLWVGRLSGLLVIAAAVIYAVFFIEQVLYSFLLTETMATYMGIAVVGGFIWRRANRWGAITGIVTAFTVNFAMYAALGKRFDHWDPNVFLTALAAGSVVFVLISLLTKPEPAAQTAAFFQRLEDGPPLLLVDLLRPKKRPLFQAYREDWKGFGAAWLVVAALLLLAWAVVTVC
jgi:Na+/proline symporter